MTDFSLDRRAAVDGAKAIFPLAVPGVPFGMVLGFIVKSEGIDLLAGWSTSWLIFAGASQLAALNLVTEGASAIVIISSVLLINSRHAMYSAVLRPKFAEMPRWFRTFAPYLLLDQLFAVAASASELEASTPRYRMWHYLGGGAAVWTMWQIAVAVGIVVGDLIREEWSLSFAVPVLFTGLLVLSVKDRPGIIAATVAATVAVAGRNLQQGAGLILGILAGVIVAGLVSARLEETATS